MILAGLQASEGRGECRLPWMDIGLAGLLLQAAWLGCHVDEARSAGIQTSQGDAMRRECCSLCGDANVCECDAACEGRRSDVGAKPEGEPWWGLEALDGRLPLQTAECGEACSTLVWRGEARGDGLGSSVAAGPDLDGDGLGDIVVGAPMAGCGEALLCGRVYAVSGASGHSIWTLGGRRERRWLGSVVAVGPDVNGDDIGDVVLGCPVAGDSRGYPTEIVYLVSGATGEVVRHWTGERAFEGFGESVSVVADVDGDGLGEVAVGAPRGSSPGHAGVGRVVLFSGATGDVLDEWHGEARYLLPDEEGGGVLGERLQLGWNVSGRYDVTCDGVGDLLVGGLVWVGVGLEAHSVAVVLSGASRDVAYALWGTGWADRFGLTGALGPDVNGDDCSDVVVGGRSLDEPAPTTRGDVLAFAGIDGTLLWRFDTPPHAGDSMNVVDLGPDADGDGLGDVVVGAATARPEGMEEAGSAWLVSGATGAAVAEWSGGEAHALFGQRVSLGADSDGDGRADVVIGAPGVADWTGEVWLCRSSGWTTQEDAR